MLDAHSYLYDQAYRYRRLMMAKFADPEEFARAHESLAQLTIDRARSAASAALEAHIASTLILVYPETSGIAV